MSELIDTAEMYLRIIYELREEEIAPLRARIAERLGQSGPTVSQTVARMERDGLVAVCSNRQLVLSEYGERCARRVMRRHRLAERLLADVIGLEWRLVHGEACRWEHVMSTDAEKRLVAILGAPTHSPYGNPIPALEELGAPAAGEKFLDGVARLSGLLTDVPIRAVVRRISETAQAQPDVLAWLQSVGVRPGAAVEASSSPDGLTLATPGGRDELPLVVAGYLYVATS